MVGDRWRDIEAGQAAGCSHDLRSTTDYDQDAADARRDKTVRSLPEAVRLHHRAEHSEGKCHDRTKRRYAEDQDFRRRRRYQGMRRGCRQSADQGLHHQPHADARRRRRRLQGLRARGARGRSRTGRSRSRCSPTTSPTMEQQAREIASWGKNVYVKIPVTNTKGEFCRPADRAACRAPASSSTSRPS